MESKKIYEELENTENLSKIYLKLGEYYDQMKNFKNSLFNFNKALEIFESENNLMQFSVCKQLVENIKSKYESEKTETESYLELEETDSTPYILITETITKIKGTSCPENSVEFYSNIKQVLEMNIPFSELENKYIFELNFEYLNTGSTSTLMKLLGALYKKEINFEIN